jgi:hypothetical protein
MDNYTFHVTGFIGFEDEILRIRNANRSVVQTRNYLDWRYAKISGGPDPVVFWVRSSAGKNVGMASMIYRPYLMDNKPLYLGVIGDISLDSSLRGKGLGRQLLMYVKNHLDRNLPDTTAFVIPTEAAYKSLIAARWEFGGKLVPYLLILDPADKLTGLLKSRLLAKLATAPLTCLFLLSAKLHIKKGQEIQIAGKPDSSFEVFWESVPKDNMILSDRSSGFLTWRYVNHPHEKFSVARLLNAGSLAGYLIFSSSKADGTIHIYDLIVGDQGDLLSMLSLFLTHVVRRGGYSSVRLPLGDKHPYCRNLWRIGFIQREAQASFLVHWPKGFAKSRPLKWSISLGDKDI